MKELLKLRNNGNVQWLVCHDLREGPLPFSALVSNMPGRVVVISDPPWSPSDERAWRKLANADAVENYDVFLESWCSSVAAASPKHVFCIIKNNFDECLNRLLRAINRCAQWSTTLLEHFPVYYGAPGAQCRNINELLHFGQTKADMLKTDPSNLKGIEISRCVLRGLPDDFDVVGDPCIGRGLSSRIAHEFDKNCIGCEINIWRLKQAVNWLKSHGYSEY